MEALTETNVSSPAEVFKLLETGAGWMCLPVTSFVKSFIFTVSSLFYVSSANRHTGKTDMNEYSSRSHSIFRLLIESHERQAESPDPPDFLSVSSEHDEGVLTASLFLIDLAGSERLSFTNVSGTRAKEAADINRSLLMLGIVIRKLSEGGLSQHIPFRESKLTRLLQPALGGNR